MDTGRLFTKRIVAPEFIRMPKASFAHASCLEGEVRDFRYDKFIALSLAMLVVVLGQWLMVKGVAGVYHDDGIYLITAKAIAHGDGYRLINLPDSPIQTRYPILYPAVLAMIWKLWPSFPENVLLMQWISLLSGAAAVAVTYLYLIRFDYFPRSVVAAAISLSVTSPPFLFFCTSCLSEMPFALSLVTAMWILDSQIEAPLARRTALFLLGTALALPLLCRTIGIATGLVVVALALLRDRRLRWLALGTVLIALPSLIWIPAVARWGNGSSGSGPYADYLSWWQSYGTSSLGSVLRSNAFDICLGQTPIAQIPWRDVPIWLSRTAAVFGFFSLVTMTREIRRVKALPMCLAAYLMIVLLWPWPPERFLVPVLPIMFAYLMSTTLHAAKTFPLVRKASAALLFAVFLSVNAVHLWRDIESSRANHYPGYMLRDGSLSWSSYSAMFDWIKKHTNPGDVFASGMDSMLYLYTGRFAFRPFVARPGSLFYGDPLPALGSLSELVANVRAYKAQYLVLTPMPGFSEEVPYVQFLVQAQKRYPAWIRPIYVGQDKRFVIWKVAPE